MKLHGDEEEKMSDLLKKATDHTRRIQLLEEAARQPSPGCNFLVEKVFIATNWGFPIGKLRYPFGERWKSQQRRLKGRCSMTKIGNRRSKGFEDFQTWPGF